MHFTGKPLEEWKKYGRSRTMEPRSRGPRVGSASTAKDSPLLRKSWNPASIGPRDEHLYRSRDHARNLVDCVRSRRPTICPIEEAVRADIVCQIADIAIRTRQKLRWDPGTERFVGNDKANAFSDSSDAQSLANMSPR